MKKTSFQALVLLIYALLSCNIVFGQDIAIVGLTGNAGEDKFSFVALKDISADVVYYFTDNEYGSTTNTFDISNVESLCKFESLGLLQLSEAS